MPGAGEPPRRMPTFPFVLLIVAIAVVTWWAAEYRAWWAWVAIGAVILVAPYVRKRWSAPHWVDRMNPKVERAMPRYWAGVGWASLAAGILFFVVAPFGLVVGLVRPDYGLAVGNAIGLLMAYGFVRAGRWLIRNRRQPFTPPHEH